MQKENNKTPLLGMTADQLCEVVTGLGLPRYTAGQIAQWIYGKHVTDIEAMSNLSKTAREGLLQSYCVGEISPSKRVESEDGTVKYLFPIDEERSVETVFIPDEDRGTVCVSCQVGCKMGCMFCQTGKQGFQGQLTTRDIINQIFSLPEREQITNIVFMGQGEPMDNLNNILQSIEILTARYGYAMSHKRITVSTVGLKGKLRNYLERTQCHLAISMHSPFGKERESIMPAQNAMPIRQIIEEVKQFDFSHQRRLSFEYILFKDFNDTNKHADEIIRLLQGIRCRVNLIPFHRIPGITLTPTGIQRIKQFRDRLTAKGVFTTIRASRGEDILAACGMLNTQQKQQQKDNNKQNHKKNHKKTQRSHQHKTHHNGK